MRTTAVATRSSRKRRPITRRDWATDRRGRGKRRVWMGSRSRRAATRPLFFSLNAQQMKRSRLTDWIGAAAMLLGVASWGVLAALLAS